MKLVGYRLIFLWLLLMLFSSHRANTQTLKRVKEFHHGDVVNVAIDRLGNFFLLFKNGTIKKYDLNGKVLAELKNKKLPTLIAPWFHPKIFIYDQSQQQTTTFDRNFLDPERRPLDPSIAIKPLLACPTNDNKLLVLDGADFSIKKVNPSTSEVLTEFYLDSTKQDGAHQFVDIREYQNLIFLLDINFGIEIYNIVGKKVNQIKTASNNFGFFGEELYYVQPGKIVFFDLYTEKRRELKIDEVKFALVSDERILMVDKKNKVSIFEFSTNNLKE